MKPVNAEDNPGLAKLPTEVRNKMGYMKKGGMTKHPMKKGSKRMKKFEDGGYTGDDEIVQYRMGQIKDPGIDLFKLVQGEEQVAKPIPLDKKPAEIKTETKTVTRPIIEAGAEEETSVRSKPIAAAKKQSFGEAFKIARAGGGKTFTFNGKSYTTELANPSSSSTTTSSAKPTTKVESKSETKNPYDSNAANAAIKTQANLDSAYTPSRAKPNTLQEKRDTREAGRKAIDAKTSGMASKDRDAMRKGGSVKMASGGKVSSASKRADGCAIRGKTRA